MTPFWETLEGKIAKIWSVRVGICNILKLVTECVALSHLSYKTDDTF